MPVGRQGGFSNSYLQRVLVGTPDHVYAIADGTAVKVGRTVEHPVVRLRDLQTANPRVLVLLAWTTTLTERQAHRTFWRWHVRGEWFEPDAGLLAKLQSWDWIDAAALGALGSDVPTAELERLHLRYVLEEEEAARERRESGGMWDQGDDRDDEPPADQGDGAMRHREGCFSPAIGRRSGSGSRGTDADADADADAADLACVASWDDGHDYHAAYPWRKARKGNWTKPLGSGRWVTVFQGQKSGGWFYVLARKFSRGYRTRADALQAAEDAIAQEDVA
jgi:hypothetical protein